MTILAVNDVAPAVVADERHPKYRKNPPPRETPRRQEQIAGKSVQFTGDQAPTQLEIETFMQQQVAKEVTALAAANGEALNDRLVAGMAKNDPVTAKVVEVLKVAGAI